MQFQIILTEKSPVFVGKGLLNLLFYAYGRDHGRSVIQMAPVLLNTFLNILSDLVKIKNLWQDANTKYNTGITTN